MTIAVEEQNTLSALNPFCDLIASLAKLDCVTFHLTQGQEFFEHHPQDSWVFQTHDHGITVIMDTGVSMNADKASSWYMRRASQRLLSDQQCLWHFVYLFCYQRHLFIIINQTVM